MKTCIECGWYGEEKEAWTERFSGDKVCPSCDKIDCIQDEVQLHLLLGKDWEHLVTVNKPVRFARAVRRTDSDFKTGLPTVKELARAISAIFEVPVRVIGNGADIVIDEF